MPTAAKLVAGLALAVTAAVAALVFLNGGGTNMPLGLGFVAGNAAVGFFTGWFTLGRNPGHGVMSAAFNGLRTLVLLLIASGVVFSTLFVGRNLNNVTLRDPIDLPLLWIQTAFDYVVDALMRDVVIALLIGGVLSGVLAYLAGRRWT